MTSRSEFRNSQIQRLFDLVKAAINQDFTLVNFHKTESARVLSIKQPGGNDFILDNFDGHINSGELLFIDDSISTERSTIKSLITKLIEGKKLDPSNFRAIGLCIYRNY